MRALRALVLLFVAAAGGLGVAHAQKAPSVEQSAPNGDTTNAMCVWGFLSSLREVGRRCDGAQFNTGYSQRSRALQAEIDESTRRLERYLVEHNPSASALIDRTREQIRATSTEEMCNSEIGRGYPNLVMQRGSGWVRSVTDQVLSGTAPNACL